MDRHDISRKSQYRVIGLMSGSSLDGLDIASCVFRKTDSGWRYSIGQCETVKYPSSWLSRLSGAYTATGLELMKLDADYGAYLGSVVAKFVRRHNLRADFVASHGHTVFHQPERGFTTQIGNGHTLHAACGLPVICDFRSEDVAFGGQGAPLVPAGDKLLFHEYDVCLNLGGIANLSFERKKKRLAFDICFCNMGLNYLAARLGKPFDRNGLIAAAGEVDGGMLERLRKVNSKFHKSRPSLGREIFEQSIAPILDSKEIAVENALCTFTESVATEICDAILSHSKGQVLCTGGGAFNSYLMSRMLDHGGDDITFILPEAEVIKFKEALVFAFLGVLRVRNEVNCLKSVTGASKDTSGGVMIGF